jgi:1,4-dihydroxy-2-naphthoate octaprenyltransferase
MTQAAGHKIISPIQAWILAARPKTLPAAISPVLIGTVMAFGDGLAHLPTAFICLFSALMIQIATNLTNDYFDFKKGADTTERLGPTRVTQAGLIKPSAMLVAIVLTFALAAFGAFCVYQRAGTPILIIAILSLLSGFLYTAGPWPLGYLGLGDLFVLIFFGPVAVAGTYYAQTLDINPAVFLAGFGPGLLSVGVLAINNLRDIESDRKANKKTLAVRFGKTFAQGEYIFVILAAALIPILVYSFARAHFAMTMASLISILAIPAILSVLTKSDGPSLNKALAHTGKLIFIYSVLFSIGWLW